LDQMASGQTWKPKCVVRVKWERPLEAPVCGIFYSHLWKNFSCIPEEVGDMESEWTIFRASIVEELLGAVVRRPKNPLVDTSGDGSRQAEEGGLSGFVGTGVS